LKFVIERRGGKELIDYSGRGLKIEAMANVQDLEHYLLKMVNNTILELVKVFLSITFASELL